MIEKEISVKPKLHIVYTPLSKAATFLMEGITIDDVARIPLNLRKQILFKILSRVSFCLRLYKLSAYFRYEPTTLRRLKSVNSSLLCWDCCRLKEYEIINEITKAENKTIFFWNPLFYWSNDKIYLQTIFKKLRSCGFRLCSFDAKGSEQYGLDLLPNVNPKKFIRK